MISPLACPEADVVRCSDRCGDLSLRGRPQGAHVTSEYNSNSAGADRDNGQGDAVLGEVLGALIGDESLEKVHGSFLLSGGIPQITLLEQTPESHVHFSSSRGGAKANRLP